MNVVRSITRALLLRCPHCGAGGLRAGAIGIVPRCPGCGLRLDRGESDYFLGAYTINLFGALLLAAALTVTAVAFTGVPRAVWVVVVIAAIAGFAFWFYPFARIVWLAADLAFRPAEPKDFEESLPTGS